MPSEMRRLALYQAHGQVLALTANEFNDASYPRISSAVEVEFPLSPTSDRLQALEREQSLLESSTSLRLQQIRTARQQIMQEIARRDDGGPYTLEEPLDPRRDCNEPICANE